MSNFKKRFAWQEQYMSEVIRLIAPHIITISRKEVDQNENGDLELSLPRDGTISVRLRTPEYARFAGDITFRSKSHNRGYTEISKVIDGYGDYFFYGHVSHSGDIWFWHLLSLAGVRSAFQRKPSLLQREQKKNGDGTRFLVYQPDTDFPDAVLASSKDAVRAKHDAASESAQGTLEGL